MHRATLRLVPSLLVEPFLVLLGGVVRVPRLSIKLGKLFPPRVSLLGRHLVLSAKESIVSFFELLLVQTKDKTQLLSLFRPRLVPEPFQFALFEDSGSFLCCKASPDPPRSRRLRMSWVARAVRRCACYGWHSSLCLRVPPGKTIRVGPEPKLGSDAS